MKGPLIIKNLKEKHEKGRENLASWAQQQGLNRNENGLKL
jgi:hypothetical protein